MNTLIIILCASALIIISGEVSRYIWTHKMHEVPIVFIFKPSLRHNPIHRSHITLSNMHALAFIYASSLALTRVVSLKTCRHNASWHLIWNLIILNHFIIIRLIILLLCIIIIMSTSCTSSHNYLTSSSHQITWLHHHLTSSRHYTTLSHHHIIILHHHIII